MALGPCSTRQSRSMTAAAGRDLRQSRGQDHQSTLARAGQFLFRSRHVLYSTCNKALAKFNPGVPWRRPASASAHRHRYDRNRTGRKAVQYEAVRQRQAPNPSMRPSVRSGFSRHAEHAVEVIETEFPVRVKRYEWIKDSAGAGLHRAAGQSQGNMSCSGDATTTLRLGHQFKFGGWGVLTARIRRSSALSSTRAPIASVR